MRVLVTGGTGVIGSAVVRRLVARGDRVAAIVRDPAHAEPLRELGVEVRVGDLSRTAAIVDAMRGSEAAVHLVGDQRVGTTADDRTGMLDANVGTTHRALDAASITGLDRLVVVSTVGIFGDTRGRIVDERFRRDLAAGFISFDDETRFLAHRAAEERVAAGDPIILVMPGVAYGPEDRSEVGRQLRAAHDGTLRFVSMADVGISAAHVDDVAAGIVAALDRGRIGESYVLGGENTRLIDAMRVAARVGGTSLPRFIVPSAMVRLLSRTPGWMSRAAGLPDDPNEAMRAGRGVTHWASSAKAATELGYVPRDLASGLRATFRDG